eukprot:SAG22_NODE_136_length_18095_cov_19.897255_9_plen_175_part_00
MSSLVLQLESCCQAVKAVPFLAGWLCLAWTATPGRSWPTATSTAGACAGTWPRLPSGSAKPPSKVRSCAAPPFPALLNADQEERLLQQPDSTVRGIQATAARCASWPRVTRTAAASSGEASATHVLHFHCSPSLCVLRISFLACGSTDGQVLPRRDLAEASRWDGRAEAAEAVE